MSEEPFNGGEAVPGSLAEVTQRLDPLLYKDEHGTITGINYGQLSQQYPERMQKLHDDGLMLDPADAVPQTSLRDTDDAQFLADSRNFRIQFGTRGPLAQPTADAQLAYRRLNIISPELVSFLHGQEQAFEDAAGQFRAGLMEFTVNPADMPQRHHMGEYIGGLRLAYGIESHLVSPSPTADANALIT